MIIDNFLFCNEYDILELRLEIMGDYVDKFVIIEADTTFTGNKKDYNLEKEFHRFKKWKKKNQYFKVKNTNIRDSWSNEDWQRDQFSLGWDNVGNDDVLLINDVDEIVRPETLEFIKNTDYNYYSLMMPSSYYKFNYIDTASHYSPWGKAFRGYKSRGSQMRNFNGTVNKSITLHHAGWHFSWIGNEDFVRYKSVSFSHTELNNEHILNNVNLEKHISEGKDHWRNNSNWKAVNLDEYFPEHILKNKERYQYYILNDFGIKVQDVYPYKILEEKK
jgi:hypothetical protein